MMRGIIEISLRSSFILDVKMLESFLLAISSENLIETAPVPDPFISNVKLLMHMNGALGSTVFIDSTGLNTFTVGGAGPVTISNVKSRYGGASALFNGGPGFINGINKPGYSFGTSDFTVEAYVYMISLAGSGGGGGNSTIMAGLGSNSDGGGQSRWALIVTPTGALMFDNAPESSANKFNVLTPAESITTNRWYHVAVSRIAGVLFVTINGVLQNFTLTGNGTNKLVTTSGSFRVGRLFSSSTFDFRLNGYIDEIRITNGIGRYNASFSALHAPFIDPGV